MKREAVKIDLPGQSVAILANQQLCTKFKRTGKDTWTVKTGAITTDITYHGSATAKGVAHAVAVTARLLENKLTERIAQDLARLGEDTLRKNVRSAGPKESTTENGASA